MSERFSRDDWHYVRSQADLTAVRLRAKGIWAGGFDRLPAVEQRQYVDFTRATKLELPQDLVHLLIKFSGGWTFEWRLARGTPPRDVNVPAAPSRLGLREMFVGVSDRRTILDYYRAWQSWQFQEYADTMNHHFLLSGEGPMVDCLALRFDVQPAQVVLLDHEFGFDPAQSKVICRGFREFVLAWATLGFPDWYDLPKLPSAARGQLAADDEFGRAWQAWLADPTATGHAESSL
jgi:hypothetical protein